MAVVNTKSAIITGLDARPAVIQDPRVYHGRLREQIATLNKAAADNDTSVFRFARLHSSWRVSEIAVFNDAITGFTSGDIGLLQTAENGGGATGADADLFATAVSFASARAATGPVDLIAEALDIVNLHKPIWELLGLSTDPGRFYDLAITGNTVGTAAGDITIRTRYVAGD